MVQQLNKTDFPPSYFERSIKPLLVPGYEQDDGPQLKE